MANGFEGSGVDVVQLATSVEALGCGELLVNCIDHDGQNDGFDCGLLKQIRSGLSRRDESLPAVCWNGQPLGEQFLRESQAALRVFGE